MHPWLAHVLVPIPPTLQVGVILHVSTALDAEEGLVPAWVLAGDCLPDHEMHMASILAES